MAATPPPADPGIPWAMLATWLGLALSFAWNWLNYQRTGKIRTSTIRFDQFKSVRSPVDAQLAHLREDMASLRAFEIAAADAAELRTQLGEIQKTIQGHFNSLEYALRILDDSAFASGQDWAGSVSDQWDEFARTIDTAYAPHRTGAQMQTVVRDSAVRLHELLSTLQRKLEGEVDRYLKT